MNRILTITLCVLALALSACGSGNSNSDTDSGIRVSVSPVTASVAKGSTAQFTSTVTGTAVATVTWSVTGGDTYGTVDASGVYTPPATIPSTGRATIVATSAADTTKHGSAVVTVTRGPTVAFGAPSRVSDYAAGAYSSILGKRSIAVHEGSYYIYTTWADNRTGNYDIYFSRSTDGGATFSAPVKVNDDATAAEHILSSLSVSADGVIYVVWNDQRNGTKDVYFSRSLDNGLTFSANTKVNTTTSNTDQCVVAAGADDVLYVMWNDLQDGISQNIYSSASTNGGQSFAAPVAVNHGTLGAGRDAPPDASVDGNGNLFVVWSSATTESADADTYISKSTDSGTTFSAELQINDDATVNGQRHPSITIDPSDNLYVAWMDDRASPDEGHDIYMAKSTDSAASFGTNVKVNDSTDPSHRRWPVILADTLGYLSVFWQDDISGTASIYYAGSVDQGATYSAATALDSITDTDDVFAVATDSSGRLLPLWMDYRNGTANADIYMSIAQ